MTAILNPLAFRSQSSMTLSLIAEELSFSLLLCYLVVHVINVCASEVVSTLFQDDT